MFTTGSSPRPVLTALRSRSVISRSHTFKVGDRVLIQQVKRDDSRLSKPLRHGRATNVHHGQIAHDEIIGKRPRDKVQVRKNDYRILKPTLEDYIVGTPRIVTPIYPRDANLIVSHLDIHAGPPGSAHELDTPVEIFEAGTGHGGLTLFLARAIHAANPPMPPVNHEEEELVSLEPETKASPDSVDMAHGQNQGPAPFPESWRHQRKAVIHTLDISPHNSLLARRIVRGFNRGMYAGNVDFYVGEIPQWIASQQAMRYIEGESDRAFLDYAILDLPGCHKYISDVANALKTDGKLLVFNPSVTQIASCVEVVRKQRLPLIMDKVLELGSGITGGRQWDIHTVKPKAVTRATNDAHAASTESRDSERTPELEKINDTGYETVCRPTPFNRVTGGGFLAIWEKMASTV